METKAMDSKQEKKRVLLTHGNKKVFFSHFGTAVVGGAIGASIREIIPITPTDDPKDEPGNLPNNDPKDKPGNGPQDAPKNESKSDPKEEPRNEPKHEPNEESRVEPRNETKDDSKEEPKDESKDKSKGESRDETKDDSAPDNPNQEEIDKIADNLIKDSKIDARDAIDQDSFMHFTDHVKINMPNGLEVDGFGFNLEGDDFVLADLDGDGIYDDLLAHVDGKLLDIIVPLIGPNGEVVTTLNQFLARNRLTESDIEQIVNSTGGEINLAMTDLERRQMEEDDTTDDIHDNGVDEDDTSQLSPEEERILMNDLLGKKDDSIYTGITAQLTPEETKKLLESLNDTVDNDIDNPTDEPEEDDVDEDDILFDDMDDLLLI